MLKKELKIEFFKSRGPGGQHKNKRFMAVRVTHLPTGLTAVAQEYRSQAVNKEAALARLAQKLKVLSRPRPLRIATRPSRSAKEKKLRWKRRHAAKKKLRGERFEEE